MKLSRRMELYNGDLLFREFKPELIDEAKVLEQALDDAITDPECRIKLLEKELAEVTIKRHLSESEYGGLVKWDTVKNRIKILEKELAEVRAENQILIGGFENINSDFICWSLRQAKDIAGRMLKWKLKSKPDCKGCVRAKGGEPADVYHQTCFYCCRPDWSNTDHYQAKGV